MSVMSRRRSLQTLGALAGAALLHGSSREAAAAKGDPKVEAAIEKGL